MRGDHQQNRLTAAITAATDKAAAVLAPALPWIFVAIRRAWIPSFASLLLAVLFFAVPQTREVLHGLSEPVLASMAEFDAGDSVSVNAWALSAYVVTAVLLGLAIWYSARLLCTVDAQQGRPTALSDPVGNRRLAFAATWYPRGLGVAVLAAAAGALIHATYAPHYATPTRAVLLALLAIAGPLLAALGQLRAGGSARSDKGTLLLYALGAVAWTVSVGLLVRLHPKWPMWTWCIAAALSPALLLLFLVNRRRLLERRTQGEPHKAPAKETVKERPFGDVIVTIVVLVLLSATVLLLLALLPPVAMRYYGSAAAILLFLGVAVLLSAGLQLLLWRVAHEIPGFTTACMVVVALLVAVVGKEDLGTEELKLQETLNPSLPAGATSPAVVMDGNPDITRVVAPAAAPTAASAVPPTLFVNAHGGGLRAAVFTAQVLARVDDASCGRFGERVAAFSGASGGSLGIATYLLARQELMADGGWKHCRASSALSHPEQPLTSIVGRTLVQDHLSPVISRMLAVDAPHLWGSPMRGQALLDSWNGALGTALSVQFKRSRDNFPAFSLPLSRLTGGLQPPPDVFFNATDADTGHITWFSNADGGTAGTYGRTAERVALSVGQAALHSARFPIVSPAGQFAFPTEKQRQVRLVDGGYADNSGTMTLLDAKQSNRPGRGPAEEQRLINIDGNPGGQTPCPGSVTASPPLITAVRALFQVRSAHAERAVKHLSDQPGLPAINVRLDLREAYAQSGRNDATVCDMVQRAQEAPLGWYMSYEAAVELVKTVEVGVKQLCGGLALGCEQAP